MSLIVRIKKELNTMVKPEKAAFLPKFFQAFPGGYGEGDSFIGVSVPDQRKVAKKYYRIITLPELEELLRSPVHEHRLTALFILVLKYEKSKVVKESQDLVEFYLNNLQSINNWDLVDSSAYKILGHYLYDKNRDLLYNLASSGSLWKERIAIIATYYFIRHGEFDDTMKLAGLMLGHEHDLIHKAVGWMIREIGNRDFKRAYSFLEEHYHKMPRTMLRYAIEKFDPALRRKFLEGSV